MPILVKDFTWTQNDTKICINLPLKGTKASSLDVLNSQEFCKISYPPFLFECWFNERVEDEKCVAIVNNGIISLEFKKLTEKNWPNLFHSEFENKELLKQVREDAIKLAGERAERLAKQKTETIAENKKIAIKEQMRIEQEQREKIEHIKESEKKRATDDIEKLKQLQKTIKPIEEPKKVDQKLEAKESSKLNENKLIFDNFKETKKQKEKIIPEPRSTGTIQIKFTPRVFPTPSRESQNEQERQWLENQAEARRLPDLPDDLKDLEPNEKNFDWLKDKAGELYKQENFHAAIGVYNHALKLFPKIASLYLNRSACHYKLRNLMKCIEDTTRALELLTPAVDENASSRLKAHVRRGTAFCEMELFAEGLMEYEAALKIQPDNEDIREDAEKIRNIIVGSPPELK